MAKKIDPKEIVKVLQGAQKLLADEERWIKGVSAKNAEGYEVGSTSPAACKFCFMGALVRSASDVNPRKWMALEEEASKLLTANGFNSWIPDWNDANERTHTDVMMALDFGILLAKQEARAA